MRTQRKAISLVLAILMLLGLMAPLTPGAFAAEEAIGQEAFGRLPADAISNSSVELYNTTDVAMDLSAYPVQRSNDDPQRQRFPSIHIDQAAEPHDSPILGVGVHRDRWTPTRISIRDTESEWEFEDAPVDIRGRGNSTWRNMGEKRPYRLRFPQARSIFGSDVTARNWTLIANAIDHSQMRNFSAFHLGNSLGNFDYTPDHRFVHLYMGGEYRGVYMQSNHRHDATPYILGLTHDPADPSASEYFFEWCRHPPPATDRYFSAAGTYFELSFPDIPFTTYAQMQSNPHVAWLRDFVREATARFARGDYAEVAEMVDIASFIDFYLVNELYKNADINFSSLFFTVRQTETGPKLFAGPLWDFDQSSGNTRADFYPDYSPQGAWVATQNVWFRDLMRADWFSAMTHDRWNEIRDREVAAAIAHIQYMAETYADCFERNFERWDVLGRYIWRTSPTVRGITTFQGQVDFLVSWLEERMEWMDGFLRPRGGRITPTAVRANSWSTAELNNAGGEYWRVLDDALNTHWHSRWGAGGGITGPNAFPLFLEFDFGEEVEIHEIALCRRAVGGTNGVILAGNIQSHASLADTWPGNAEFLPSASWQFEQALPTFASAGAVPGTVYVPLDQPITARYLRIEITAGILGHASLARFRAFGGLSWAVTFGEEVIRVADGARINPADIPTPYRPDYNFLGWYLVEHPGPSDMPVDFDMPITRNIRLFARFAPPPAPHTISWALVGGAWSGEFTPPATVADGGTIAAIAEAN
ncbi:MAG: CotH kinase family protein, partial [Oscillospiraceae bacterium]|nr:CotH kinase family protein [Oscillospiraceae bacterium]